MGNRKKLISRARRRQRHANKKKKFNKPIKTK